MAFKPTVGLIDLNMNTEPDWPQNEDKAQMASKWSLDLIGFNSKYYAQLASTTNTKPDWPEKYIEGSIDPINEW